MRRADVRSVRVAVIQDAPVLFEVEPTLEKVAELSDRAAADGAQLAVSPKRSSEAIPRGQISGRSWASTPVVTPW
jgi:nitrilase